MLLNPSATTVGDLCSASLRECGALGVGQTALAQDVNESWSRLQMMLQQWERKRWFVYHLVDYSIVSTGALSYTVGPGGQINTGANSMRPSRIESAFVRQIQTSPPNQVDYQLIILQSREDYNKVTLKSLVSFPEAAFYDSDFPLANLFVWPVPNASIYEIHISLRAQLPRSFPSLATVVTLPEEDYAAILYNLAIRNRPRYRIGTWPGDPLPDLARESLAVMRGANTQIARLSMPPGLLRSSNQYNIFSDTYR